VGILLFLDGAGEAASGAGARPCVWAQGIARSCTWAQGAGAGASATAEAGGPDAAHDAHAEAVASGLHAYYVSNSFHNLKSCVAVCSPCWYEERSSIGSFRICCNFEEKNVALQSQEGKKGWC
jgi:hypothetical protein